MKQNKMTCASFFAGVGGIDIGFEETGVFNTIYANEFDKYPAETMEKNFDIKVDTSDITQLDPENVPNTEVIMGGFPCQAFSIAGYRKGFEDEKGRGTLFFDLLRMIKAKKPRVVFCENVKNLVSHDGGNTFKVIREALDDAGYLVKDRVMNAMEYGNIPQNRERIYIVAFRDEEDYKNFDFPEPIELTKTIKDVIDFDHKVDDRFYYTPGKYKNNLYKKLDDAMTDPDAVYQWRRKYVRKNKSGVVPTLTANMGEGGHNVPLVRTKYGIRKITPAEAFYIQGFPKDFILPEDQSDARLYKQAGNSVCVTVIRRIADNIAKAIKLTNSELKDSAVTDISTDKIITYMDSLKSSRDKQVIKDMLQAVKNG